MNSEPHPFDNAPLCHPSAQCTLNLDGTLSLIFNISSAFETNLLLRVPSLSVRSRVIVKVVLAAKQAVLTSCTCDLVAGNLLRQLGHSCSVRLTSPDIHAQTNLALQTMRYV
jgi:hypothetical protein